MIYIFQGISNARTLGGIPCADGRRIKENMLIRSGNLYKATDVDTAFLGDKIGVKTVIDFRSMKEISKAPDADIKGARYHALPVFEDFYLDLKHLPSDVSGMFSNFYHDITRGEAADRAYREFFSLLLESEGAVLWHCTQGKDRTGVAALLLLTVLGAPMDKIIDDYMLTNSSMLQELERIKDKISPEFRDALNYVMFVQRETAEQYVSLIEERCGSLDNYIRDVLLVSEEDTVKLRDKYLE